MSHLQAQRVTIDIGGKTLCRDLQLSIEPGQVWAILGRNGAGKTTLLHSLTGLYPLSQGQVLLNGQDLRNQSRRHIAQKIGLLLQHHEDSFPSTVYDTVLAARYPHIDFWQWESADDHQQTEAALHAVGLYELRQRLGNQLSGGERQRTAIAALLAQSPDIYLLDEPNSHLDLNHQIHLLKHLVTLAREQNKSLLMSLHDLNLAARFCTHVLLLQGDAQAVSGPCEILQQTELLNNVYGHPISHLEQSGRLIFWAE